MLNVEAGSFESVEPVLGGVQRAAARGNRIVVALRRHDQEKPPETKGLEEKWHVKIGIDKLPHRSRLYFADAKGWDNLYLSGNRLLAIERAFGKGSVVLFAESGDFTNDATVSADRLRQVTAAIGRNTHIVFDEAHLGISESGSVVALALRFHLMGLGIGLGLFAALLLWRNGSEFPPAAREKETAGSLSGRTSHAGLLTLLRRHIPPSKLAATCWQEWLAGNRGQVKPERVLRAEAIVRNAGADPLDALREIQAVLHSKGEL
jgi:hypothetical protein